MVRSGLLIDIFEGAMRGKSKWFGTICGVDCCDSAFDEFFSSSADTDFGESCEKFRKRVGVRSIKICASESCLTDAIGISSGETKTQFE